MAPRGMVEMALCMTTFICWRQKLGKLARVCKIVSCAQVLVLDSLVGKCIHIQWFHCAMDGIPQLLVSSGCVGVIGSAPVGGKGVHPVQGFHWPVLPQIDLRYTLNGNILKLPW